MQFTFALEFEEVTFFQKSYVIGFAIFSLFIDQRLTKLNGYV